MNESLSNLHGVFNHSTEMLCEVFKKQVIGNGREWVGGWGWGSRNRCKGVIGEDVRKEITKQIYQKKE